MDARFCIEALNEAMALHGRPEIFNTDQGSQFASLALTGLLKLGQIAISMGDGASTTSSSNANFENDSDIGSVISSRKTP